MKKGLCLCLIGLFISSFCHAKTAFYERSEEFYLKLGEEGSSFYTKLKNCSPAYCNATKEKIYGVTNKGQCHYSYQEKVNNSYKEYHCIIPLQVAIGYATTTLDIYDYKKYNDGRTVLQIVKQNNEIRKILLDYCQKNTK